MPAACLAAGAALAPVARERIALVSPRRLPAPAGLGGRAAVAGLGGRAAAARGGLPWLARAGVHDRLWLPVSRGAAFCVSPRAAPGVGAWVRGGRRVGSGAWCACRWCVFRVFLCCFVICPSPTPRTNGPPSLFLRLSCMTSCPASREVLPDWFPGRAFARVRAPRIGFRGGRGPAARGKKKPRRPSRPTGGLPRPGKFC